MLLEDFVKVNPKTDRSAFPPHRAVHIPSQCKLAEANLPHGWSRRVKRADVTIPHDCVRCGVPKCWRRAISWFELLIWERRFALEGGGRGGREGREASLITWV